MFVCGQGGWLNDDGEVSLEKWMMLGKEYVNHLPEFYQLEFHFCHKRSEIAFLN